MPRLPRQKSDSGIYHILQNYKAVSEYKVFAYCLMSNHIHILIKVEKEDLDLIMKR